MVHFTCDLCGKELNASEPRFVVKIEAFAGFDPTEITEEDLDDDHMEAISEILQRDPHPGAEGLDEPNYRGFRFDLCSACHGRFIKDPLSREVFRLLNFSEN